MGVHYMFKSLWFLQDAPSSLLSPSSFTHSSLLSLQLSFPRGLCSLGQTGTCFHKQAPLSLGLLPSSLPTPFHVQGRTCIQGWGSIPALKPNSSSCCTYYPLWLLSHDLQDGSQIVYGSSHVCFLTNKHHGYVSHLTQGRPGFLLLPSPE